MANLAYFKFFDFDSTDTISSAFVNPNKGDSITLEVRSNGSADFDLVIEGKCDTVDSDGWFPISPFKLDGFKLLSNITEEGLYCFTLEGITKVRLVNNGTPGGFKAFGVSTGDR